MYLKTDRIPLAFHTFSTSVAGVNTVNSAGFVADDKSVTFALNIPQADDNDDLWLTMSGPSDSSWIVSALKPALMQLMLIMYRLLVWEAARWKIA